MNLIQLLLEGITYKIPNFNFEWEEAIRYPEFKKLGKQAWINIASKGKGVSINSAKDINNTDANKPSSFRLLNKDKQKRTLLQLKSGTVEMPIIAVYPDGHKELLGGNTRLTALMYKNGKATVWMFDVPEDILEKVVNDKIVCDNCGWEWKIKDGGDDLYMCHKCDHNNSPTALENFKDGKKKGKSKPGRVKKSGASCNGSVTDLRKKAKNASGEKAKMYHWCANMKGGKKK
tara:strand:- start:1309 stop:2004 length:696 start_codon:yes stop_codon:yes gene_type:complete